MEENQQVPKTKNQRSPLTRTVDILLRTAHIGVSAVLMGGAVFHQPLAALGPWAKLTAVTGLGLVASEVHHSRRWPYQGRGIMAMIHVGWVVALHFWLQHAALFLWCALVFGVVGSHMPKWMRHWSFLHGRPMD
jgi:hypothetical protein